MATEQEWERAQQTGDDADGTALAHQCYRGAGVGMSEPEVDPEEFLRALRKISPEHAAKAREDAAKRGQLRQDGPTADYGDDK